MVTEVRFAAAANMDIFPLEAILWSIGLSLPPTNQPISANPCSEKYKRCVPVGGSIF